MRAFISFPTTEKREVNKRGPKKYSDSRENSERKHLGEREINCSE